MLLFLCDYCLYLGLIVSHVYIYNSFLTFPSRLVHTSLHIPLRVLASLMKFPPYRIKSKSPAGSPHHFSSPSSLCILPPHLSKPCPFLNMQHPHSSDHLPRPFPEPRCSPPSHEVLCSGYLVCHSSPRNGWIDWHALSIARSMQSLAMRWPSLIWALFRINLAQILLNHLEMCYSLSLYQIHGQLNPPSLSRWLKASLSCSVLTGWAFPVQYR